MNVVYPKEDFAIRPVGKRVIASPLVGTDDTVANTKSFFDPLMRSILYTFQQAALNALPQDQESLFIE
jgi:hypothetical protein